MIFFIWFNSIITQYDGMFSQLYKLMGLDDVVQICEDSSFRLIVCAGDKIKRSNMSHNTHSAFLVRIICKLYQFVSVVRRQNCTTYFVSVIAEISVRVVLAFPLQFLSRRWTHILCKIAWC